MMDDVRVTWWQRLRLRWRARHATDDDFVEVGPPTSGRPMLVHLHAIAEDGLPPDDPHLDSMHDDYIGRVALLWDGAIMSGSPLLDEDPSGGVWLVDEDVAGWGDRKVGGVTHWVEFPVPLWEIDASLTTTTREE